MEKQKPHETSAKTKKTIKFILIGISALTVISTISMPWNALTFKETIFSLMGLLFINGFLMWSYYILFIWKQRLFEHLEQQYNVKIVPSTAGSFNIIGEVSLMTKLIINLKILSYFLFGMTGPLVLIVVLFFFLR